MPLPRHSLENPRLVGKITLFPVNGERPVLTAKGPGGQGGLFCSDPCFLPHPQQRSGIEHMETDQGGDLIVQVLDQARGKRLDDMSQGDSVVLGSFCHKDIFLEHGEAFCKRRMAFGVFLHDTRQLEQPFNLWEEVPVFDFVVMVEGGEELLVEKKEVGGVLCTSLDRDSMIP